MQNGVSCARMGTLGRWETAGECAVRVAAGGKSRPSAAREKREAMNPVDLFRLAEARKKFNANHPKFGPFLKAAYEYGLREGSMIYISVTPPGGTKIETNLIVQDSDMEMLSEFMKMGSRE